MCLKGQSVLIVEDEALTALDLALAVDDEEGLVVGPFDTAGQALRHLEDAADEVTAAILDVTVRDGEITPVALWLAARNIPFIIHTGGGLPARLKAQLGAAPIFYKPASSSKLTRHLATAVAQAEIRPPPLQDTTLRPF